MPVTVLFPTSLDAFERVESTDQQNRDAILHSEHHNAKYEAIEALEAHVLGVGAPAYGAGTPEAVVTRPPGYTYWDQTNKALWVKDTGSGNTGWLLLLQIG